MMITSFLAAIDTNAPVVPATVLTLAILCVQLLTNVWQWWTNKAAKIERTHLRKTISEVSVKQNDIYMLVNHPLGAALKGNAIAMERIAHMTKDSDDILAAVAARERSDEHDSKQASLDAAKIRDSENKQKIIDEFLKNKTDKTDKTDKTTT